MADTAIQTSYDACDNRDIKLKDALLSLINITNENQSLVAALRSEHDSLRSENDALASSAASENELRKSEFQALDEKQKADAQARVMDVAKVDGKVDTEYKNRNKMAVLMALNACSSSVKKGIRQGFNLWRTNAYQQRK